MHKSGLVIQDMLRKNGAKIANGLMRIVQNGVLIIFDGAMLILKNPKRIKRNDVQESFLQTLDASQEPSGKKSRQPTAIAAYIVAGRCSA